MKIVLLLLVILAIVFSSCVDGAKLIDKGILTDYQEHQSAWSNAIKFTFDNERTYTITGVLFNYNASGEMESFVATGHYYEFWEGQSASKLVRVN